MALYDVNGNKIQIESSGSATVVNSTEQSMPVHDTTVKLYKLNSNTLNNGGIADNKNGFAVSAFYEIPEGYTGKIALALKVSEAQKASLGSVPMQLYLDDTFATYWSPGACYTVDGSEQIYNLYHAPSPANRVRFTIPMDYVDDCYAYLPDDGKILFAGKNTVYYGMSHRDGYSVVDRDSIAPYSGAKINILQGRFASEDYGLGDAYVSVVEEAKNAWMLEHGGDPRKIPLIIYTDQHSTLGNVSRGLPRLLASVVPWENVSKIVNLGDTDESFNGIYDSNNHVFGAKALTDSFAAMSVLPKEKQIHVFGNHDLCRYDHDTNGGVNQYFDLNTYDIQRFDDNGFFVVKDGLFNVKYIGVSGFNSATYRWLINANGSTAEGSGQTSISKESMDWLISELERDDGYDVVILSHYALVNTPTDGSGVSHPNIPDPVKFGDVMYGPVWAVSDQTNMDAFWAARKNKTSGTVYDTEGNAHAYDFTKVKGNLLCGLHGHAHDDNYCYIESSLLDVTVDCMYNTGHSGDFGNTFHFVLIDRRNNLLNVWKVDGSPKFQNYQIPLNK